MSFGEWLVIRLPANCADGVLRTPLRSSHREGREAEHRGRVQPAAQLLDLELHRPPALAAMHNQPERVDCTVGPAGHSPGPTSRTRRSAPKSRASGTAPRSSRSLDNTTRSTTSKMTKDSSAALGSFALRRASSDTTVETCGTARSKQPSAAPTVHETQGRYPLGTPVQSTSDTGCSSPLKLTSSRQGDHVSLTGRLATQRCRSLVQVQGFDPGETIA